MSEKRFIKGSAKEITGSYGSFFNIEINKEDFNLLPTNDYGMVKITMSALKNGPNQYGSTHYLALNTWVPGDKPKDGAVPVVENEAQRVTKDDIDLPF